MKTHKKAGAQSTLPLYYNMEYHDFIAARER